MIHFILRSSNFKEENHNSYLVVQAMSSKTQKEVHGNMRHVANTAGMKQRSKYQNELTKEKRIVNYPKEPNRQQGVSGGTTPSSMGMPSATSTKDPVIDTESDDDVSFSVVNTRKMAQLLSMIPLISPRCRWTTSYHIINFLFAWT